MGGWGAVEQEAATWHVDATVEEIETRLWIVRSPSGEVLGFIGKEPSWCVATLARRAAAEAAEHHTEGGES